MKIVNTPAYQHERVADQRVDASGVPTPESFADGRVPLVVDHSDSGDDAPLRHISDIHGRSYLLEDTPPEDRPWLDKHGNPYQAITTKGNNLTRHLLIRSGTAPSGFLPYGLQEGDALRRVIRASRVMCEAGIDTERPIGIYQPHQLAYEGELVDVPDYKRFVIEGMVKRIKSGEDTQGFTLEEVGAAADAMDQMDFFVTLRAMSTAARIGDLVVAETQPLGNITTTGLNYDSLGQVFRDYNAYGSARGALLRDLGLAQALPAEVNSETDQEAIEHYFGEVLPKLMARNMGLLHSLGLMHHFPHTNNFTGLGGIVDLDSVRGGRLRMKDKYVRDLFDQQIDEKAVISFDTLADFRRYKGHGVDWLSVSKHARENFTRTYIEFYDGSMSPSDRMKTIFLDAASYQPDNIRNGSPLVLDSLERLYPGAGAALDEVEALVLKTLSGEFDMTLEERAWFMIDHTRDPYHIWGAGEDREATDENDAILLDLGMPPTDEEILEMLPKYYDAEESDGYPQNALSFAISYLPAMKARILADLKNNSTIDIIQEFLARLPGTEGVSTEEVKPYLKSVEEEVLKRVEAQNEKPAFKEFWAVVRRMFQEKVLDSFDRSILPDNEYLQTDLDLEPFVAFWQFHRRKPAPIIEHVVSGLPAEQVTGMLPGDNTEPEIVATAEEVLRIEPPEGEEVRLVITDGTVNNVMHYADFGGEYEDINYRQYMMSDGSVPTHATRALYLLQDSGDKFRLVHKKLGTCTE
jgi:hypothetical protein